MQASFFVQDESTFNNRTGNTSTLNTVAQILLQPERGAPFKYIWQPAAALADVSRSSSGGDYVPFLVNGSAPCCINLSTRLQGMIMEANSKSNSSAPGWKHYGTPASGQLMGTCHIDTSGPLPEVQSAAFTWYSDTYNLTAEEFGADHSNLLLMISGDWRGAANATDFGDSAGETCFWSNSIHPSFAEYTSAALTC